MMTDEKKATPAAMPSIAPSVSDAKIVINVHPEDKIDDGLFGGDFKQMRPSAGKCAEIRARCVNMSVKEQIIQYFKLELSYDSHTSRTTPVVHKYDVRVKRALYEIMNEIPDPTPFSANIEILLAVGLRAVDVVDMKTWGGIKARLRETKFNEADDDTLIRFRTNKDQIALCEHFVDHNNHSKSAELLRYRIEACREIKNMLVVDEEKDTLKRLLAPAIAMSPLPNGRWCYVFDINSAHTRKIRIKTAIQLLLGLMTILSFALPAFNLFETGSKYITAVSIFIALEALLLDHYLEANSDQMVEPSLCWKFAVCCGYLHGRDYPPGDWDAIPVDIFSQRLAAPNPGDSIHNNIFRARETLNALDRSCCV